MEPEVKAFLLRIVRSLSFAVLWMMVNMTLGIFFNLGFPENGIGIINILFYIFLAATLGWLVWYLLRVWSDPVAES